MKAVKYNLVFNRTSKELGAEEKALIQVEAYLERRRKYISTGVYVLESQWDKKNSKVKKHPKQLDLNISLRNKITELQNYEYSITNKGGKFTLNMFKAFLEGKETKDFLAFIEQEKKARADITEDTKKHHSTLIQHLKNHGKIKYFSDLTYQNIADFDNWLRLEEKKTSTIYAQHKIIKSYIAKAIGQDIMDITENPYLKFKSKREKNTDRKYLTQEELTKLEKKDFSDMGTIAVMRDLFLFSCYTGLAYSDAAKLTAEDLFQENGDTWIKIRRNKTDIETVIMLLPKAQEIIAKYNGFKTGKLLPYITNQRMNGYLKLIASACEISKQLTTHVARHTFATTVTLMNGVSLEVVQKMLGHASIRTTELYAKIVNKRVQEEMNKLKDRLS